jgi:hypothetical protein
MNPNPDPVDSALFALKSENYHSGLPNPQFEEKLMQEFQNAQSSTRPRARRAWIVALAALMVGGGAFAATGGIDMIRSWFITVQIGDQVVDLELQPAGDGTAQGEYTTQLPDGSQARLQVVASEDADQQRTQVQVNVTSPGEEQEQQIEVRRATATPDMKTYGVDVLGDTRPIHSWTDAAGDALRLHLVPAEEGAIRVYLARTSGGETTVRLLASPPSRMNLSSITPTVDVADDGTLSLRFEDGENGVQMMKFRIAAGADAPEEGRTLRVETPSGPITITRPEQRDED